MVFFKSVPALIRAAIDSSSASASRAIPKLKNPIKIIDSTVERLYETSPMERPKILQQKMTAAKYKSKGIRFSPDRTTPSTVDLRPAPQNRNTREATHIARDSTHRTISPHRMPDTESDKVLIQ